MIQYYPVLRGKQYELIALREFSAAPPPNAPGFHVVIEPVRQRGQGRLRDTVRQLSTIGAQCSIIINPTVGDYSRLPDDGYYPLFSELSDIYSTPGINPAVIATGQGQVEGPIKVLEDNQESLDGALILFPRPIAASDSVEQYIRGAKHSLDLVLSASISAGRYRRFNRDRSRAVLLVPGFASRSRNQDYVEHGPELFSDAHLYAQLDGYAGIADYLTVGSDYNEGGFLPRVVAIHWTYLNEQTDEVWVRHFTSGFSSRAGDVPGKFLAAARKLVEFLDANFVENPAATEMRALVAAQRFPGLGTVKKLSMLNHLYVMADVIGESGAAE